MPELFLFFFVGLFVCLLFLLCNVLLLVQSTVYNWGRHLSILNSYYFVKIYLPVTDLCLYNNC